MAPTRRRFIGLALAGLAAGCAGRIAPDDSRIARHFGDTPGTFVLRDPAGRITRHNAARAATRFSPASTFKIPNTLIALETGVASGPDFRLPWDRKRDPPQDWWPPAWQQDHTLASALRDSVVWYYQEIARRIGAQRMQAHLDRYDYGNRSIDGGIDRFWLTGGLRISAEEQVAFLQRIFSRSIEVAARNVDTVKDLMTLERTSAYRLGGKTGWHGFGNPGTTQVGWLAGFVERRSGLWLYAMNMDMQGEQDGPRRLAMTKAALRELKVLPPDA